jgi:hypothetical protein
MKQLRINVSDLPSSASRTEWSRIIGCSVASIDRAEKLGKIGPAWYLNARVKHYPAEQILRWLGYLPATPPTPPPQQIPGQGPRKILKRVISHR